MFDLGMQELIVIFIVALLVFGPKRLPELGRTIGKGIAELKRAMQGVREQIDLEADLSTHYRPPDIRLEHPKEDSISGEERESRAEGTKEKGKDD